MAVTDKKRGVWELGVFCILTSKYIVKHVQYSLKIRVVL